MYVTIQTVKYEGELYLPGQEIDLPKPEANRLLEAGVIEHQKVVVSKSAKGGSGAGGDTRTHELTVPQARELVAGIEDVEALEQLAVGEEQHPQHDGGRKSVLEAIDDRIAELTEAE